MIIIYGIPNCDVVKKALNWFKLKKIDYQFHNFKTDGISELKILEWISKAGLDVIVNRRSTAWRNLSVEKQLEMKEIKQAIKIIRIETNIIKRPVIESERGLLIGFNDQEYQNKFLY